MLPFSMNEKYEDRFSKKNNKNKKYIVMSKKKLGNKVKIGGMSILKDLFEKIMGKKDEKTGSGISSNSNSDLFIKGSESKDIMKKGGFVRELLFPGGLSAATATLGLIALQHETKKRKMKGGKKKKTKRSGKKTTKK